MLFKIIAGVSVSRVGFKSRASVHVLVAQVLLIAAVVVGGGF